MLDFLRISERRTKQGIIEIYPKFVVKKTKDLMIRGNSFYAVWDDSIGLWTTDEHEAIELIDHELSMYTDEFKKNSEEPCRTLYLWDSENGMIDRWIKYTSKQMPNNWIQLDEKLVFANTPVSKEDYSSHRLNYALAPTDISSYEELVSTLYNPEERHKLEWAIGAIVSGDSKDIQKFVVMYGAPGSGKSTLLNVVQKLFDGYYGVFDAKALGSASNGFALEAFKANPLVAIQHDGDLSRIEDNTRLNSVVSHEVMMVNEKFKSAYASRFNSFLFVGTNKPVKITDAKSGIIRRLIDISPSGKTVSFKRYNKLIDDIDFELGGIACHCLDIYNANKRAYDKYVATSMLSATNEFYNYVLDAYDLLSRPEGVSLTAAWDRYSEYAKNANILGHEVSKRVFKEELKNYFDNFEERKTLPDGTRVRSYYTGFNFDKYDNIDHKAEIDIPDKVTMELNCTESLLDKMCEDCPAQYANEMDIPQRKWDSVTQTLKDIDTTKVHYVKIPENHIVIDFDLKDENGNKSFEKNIEAASRWPPTYAELSKGGQGIHLHYIYTGDASKLKRIYAPDIEVKVFTGNSSLRRRLSKCNDIPVASISSGLPEKGEKKVVRPEELKDEKHLRNIIKKAMRKDIPDLVSTKQNVDFIHKMLDDAYHSDILYDLTDLRPDVMTFAAASTHQSEYCIKKVLEMEFKAKVNYLNMEGYPDDAIVFFDVEIFPNLCVICYKMKGKPCVGLINPTPNDIEQLIKYRLVGFNNRKYDNHILYAIMLGYSNFELFQVSQRIVNGERGAMFGKAYNISYTDIYDFSSKKQSLKKFEIELGIHHHELGFRWDEPVPEDKWDQVVEYCCDDVIATEKVFEARKEDFVARQILAKLSGLTVNDTTRMHTTKIIFGDEEHPDLVYTDLSEIFPGYSYSYGKSSYRGEDPGEGGYVYAEPGMYTDVALLDIASMHPTSIINLNLFGKYTVRFKDIKDSRIAIKHHDYTAVEKLLDGALMEFLTDDEQADALAQALKIVINSVYGYTTATFDNPFKDPRNVDNIVAKRGALFMINLKHEVQNRGFTVAHIKTDSIKIPNATPEIIQFVMDYGQKYGYSFEHEATYQKMCLVNDAVYIARYKEPHKDKKTGKDIWWTATGKQFQVPYVFKKLFSGDQIVFEDLCETKSVTSALYLDMNELLPEEQHKYQFVGRVGQFCPILPEKGGGLLMREAGENKYASATGAKGYRWLESETVELMHKEEDIDISYYDKLVDEAADTIAKYGDLEWFISDKEDTENEYVTIPFN